MKYPNVTTELLQNLASLYALDMSAGIAELTQGELKLLNYLATHEEEQVLPSTLSTQLSLTTARIAAALNSLEKKGHVQRVPLQQDKRKIVVTLTPTGQEHLQAKYKKITKGLSRLVADMGKKDIKELNRILAQIIKLSQ